MSIGESMRREYAYEKAEYIYRGLSISEKVEEFESLLEPEERFKPLAEQADILDNYLKDECIEIIVQKW